MKDAADQAQALPSACGALKDAYTSRIQRLVHGTHERALHAVRLKRKGDAARGVDHCRGRRATAAHRLLCPSSPAGAILFIDPGPRETASKKYSSLEFGRVTATQVVYPSKKND